jgi:hypothetical protein
VNLVHGGGNGELAALANGGGETVGWLGSTAMEAVQVDGGERKEVERQEGKRVMRNVRNRRAEATVVNEWLS